MKFSLQFFCIWVVFSFLLGVYSMGKSTPDKKRITRHRPARQFHGRLFLFPRRVLGGYFRPPRRQGTLRRAKMEELRQAVGNSGVPDRVFCASFVAAPPTVVSRIYRCRVGCWAVMFAPRGMSSGSHGAPRNASGRKNSGITTRIRKFRASRLGLLVCLRLQTI